MLWCANWVPWPNAGLQIYYVQPAAFAGVSERFAVDPAGDPAFRERASVDIRSLRPGRVGSRPVAGSADPGPRRGYRR